MSTSFDSSALKSSFSLSSLRAPPAAASAADSQRMPERPYHSLTKKRKEPCREAWRRSWGSAASGGSGCGGAGGGDDLWPLLQHHYDYIMDNHIIDTCREANGELSSHNRSALPANGDVVLGTASASYSRQWSLSQLTAEFTDLCQWLSAIQEEIYSSPENLSNRSLRMSWLSELDAAECRRGKLSEQAAAIVERIPEARDEVAWRVRHLHAKWEGVRLLLSPEQEQHTAPDTVDTAHEVRCLRRWLHCMEGRLPPPSVSAARSVPPSALYRRLSQHQVLQRDVECHGRIVSSVVRLCGGADAARALERRWHLLYLRAIEWQCHLEACVARIENQGAVSPEATSDSDEEPALKQPRLCRRGGSPRLPRPSHPLRCRPPAPPASLPRSSCDSDVLYSEESQDEDYLIVTCEASETELRLSSRAYDQHTMPSIDGDCAGAEQSVPRSPAQSVSLALAAHHGADLVDGPYVEKSQDVSMYDEDEPSPRTPPTVVKRRKPVDSSKFNQSDRKSKNCATFYFKHHDTDSDRQLVSEERSQEESSEEEWTYKQGTDVMSSSVEMHLPLDDSTPTSEKPPSPKVESRTPDLLKEQPARCKEDIERLVNQAEELVQRQAQMAAAKKMSRNLKPLQLEEGGKTAAGRSKMARIKEWLQQNNHSADNFQCAESYDASGEYTTESDAGGGSGTSEPEDPSAADTSLSTLTAHRHHNTKVVMRKKRSSSGTRPWSVSCLSQLTRVSAAESRPAPAPANMAAMSISESALNTLATRTRHMPAAGSTSSKLQSSTSSVKTAVQQGHISSSTTINDTCVSCYEMGELKQCSMRRKRLKLRRRQQFEGAACARREPDGAGGARIGRSDKLVKSLSFSGRLSPQAEDKHERSAASDPPPSRKYRLDTTSTSDNDSDKEQLASQSAVAHLRRSIERTHISCAEEAARADQLMTPNFRVGAAGGAVRPRRPATDRERHLLAASLGDPAQLWDLADRDSDVDRSVHTAGTEEHSSFSEQAWDFYQEKYNSEPYSEAPDSDAARRLLEFGDDYRAYIDSQSDCCSSLSAQPEQEAGAAAAAAAARRRLQPRHRRSPGDTPRKLKSMSSAERKKSLLDSLERSRVGASLESEARRACDEASSSLEYEPQRPDVVSVCEGARGEVRALVRRSAARLLDTQQLLERVDAAPDLLRAADYNEIMTTCNENMSCLESVLAASADGVGSPTAGVLSLAQCQEIRSVSARWSALRSAAARRGNARRLRRELAALRESLADISEPSDAPPQLHTKHHLNRRIDELKERLSRLLELKVSMLKLTVSARRALAALESEGEAPGALATELTALLAAWEEVNHRTSSELLSLEKALAAWGEWESGLRELTCGLRSDQDALRQLQRHPHAAPDRLPAQLRHLADVLSEKKGSSTCGSLSDSGISDGDSEAAAAAEAATGARARRLAALRDLARDLQAALAPGSHAIRAITKRMEQAESEVRALQESCRALVSRSASEQPPAHTLSDGGVSAGGKSDAAEPEYSGGRHWMWRVMRSALPFQLCLVALLLAAWLLERPRCCDLLNSLAGSLTPQLRYVRGPPPV